MRSRKARGDDDWLLTYADLVTNLLVFFAMLLAAAQISRPKMQQIAESLSGTAPPTSLSAIQEEIEDQVEEAGLQEMITADRTEEGLEVSLNSGLVFASGSATVRPEQEELLQQMLQTLVPYAEHYRFAVEGHTDSQPVSPNSQFASNWELSTARANAVRSRLEIVGIDKERVRVEGYADTVPLPPEDLEGLSIDELLARHRRVVVRIY